MHCLPARSPGTFAHCFYSRFFSWRTVRQSTVHYGSLLVAVDGLPDMQICSMNNIAPPPRVGGSMDGWWNLRMLPHIYPHKLNRYFSQLFFEKDFLNHQQKPSSTLPETNSSPLKMDGWNTRTFPFGESHFQGLNISLVLGRVTHPPSHHPPSLNKKLPRIFASHHGNLRYPPPMVNSPLIRP